MKREWKVYNLYVSTPDVSHDVADTMRSYAKMLVKNGDLTDFYYTLHYIPKKVPAHIKFGFYKLKKQEEIIKKFEELKKRKKITKITPSKPDLKMADGITVERIKLTARKMTELLETEFQKPITIQQAYYLIHFTLNPFLGYIAEREIYYNLTKAVEKAIRKNKLLPKEKWYTFLNV